MVSSLQEANAVAWFATKITPVRIPATDRHGEPTLAFRSEEDRQSQERGCRRKVAENCVKGVRAGCSVQASRHCGTNWLLRFLNLAKQKDWAERDLCEERYIEGCLANGRGIDFNIEEDFLFWTHRALNKMEAHGVLQAKIEENLMTLNELAHVRNDLMHRLRKVDADVRSLTAAIGIASSGLNAATGIHCSLSPIALVSDGGQAGGLLIELCLKNGSTLRLPASCTIIVKHSWYGASTIIQSFPLPQIAPGGAWATSFVVKSSGDQRHWCTTLVVSLLFGALREIEPLLTVIHTFTVDILHYLEATSQSKMSTCASIMPPLHGGLGVGTAFHRTTLRLALPKSVFGLSPDPSILLRSLERAGNHSLLEAAATELQDGNLHLEEQVFLKKGVENQGTVSMHGMLHALQLDTGPVGLNLSLPRFGSGPAGCDSTHAVLELECEAASLSGLLGLHEAVLRRFEIMGSSEGRKGRKGDKQGGVIIPQICRLGAPVDMATLDTLQEQLDALRNHALRLKEEIDGVSTGHGVQCRSERALAKDVSALVEQLRMSIPKVPIENREVDLSYHDFGRL